MDYGTWQIEIRDEAEATGDGGFTTAIRLRHIATGKILAATIVEYEAEARMVAAFTRDDLSLTDPVGRRLLGKVFDHFGPTYRRDREFDGPGIDMIEVLGNVIDDCYRVEEADFVKAEIRDGISRGVVS